MNTYAQSPNAADLWNGTGNFILGSDKSIYGSDLKYISGDTLGIKKSYDYTYLPTQNNPFILAGVKIKTIHLSFDEKDQLRGIDMLTIYKKSDSTNSYKAAETDLKKIISYLKDNLKRKAEENYSSKTEYSRNLSYEWKKKSNIVTFQFVENTFPGSEAIVLAVGFSNSRN